MNQTAPALAVAKGDSFYATGANALARLAVGANGQLIIANSACNNGVQYEPSASFAGSSLKLTGSLVLTSTVVTGSAILRMNTSCFLEIGPFQDYPLVFITNGTERARFGNAGGSAQFLIGTTASNTVMTQGITVDQGSGTTNTEVLALKATGGVAHGVTGTDDTATFFSVQVSGGVGTAFLTGFGNGASGAAATNSQAMVLRAISSTCNTARSTAAVAPLTINSSIKSGTGVAALSASSNILALQTNGTSTYLWDGTGNAYARASWLNSAFDEHDDAELCRAIDLERNAPGLVRTAWDDLVQYGRGDLERTGLLTVNSPDDIWLNYSGATRLLLGNAWQQEIKIRELRAEIESLRRLLPAPPTDTD